MVAPSVLSLDAVDEALKGLKGLEVNGTIKISRCCGEGQCVKEVSDECNQRLIDAMSKG